jgi:hypothetical protein
MILATMSSYAPIDVPGIAQLYDTTVIDPSHDLGLSITTLRVEDLCGQPRDGAGVAEALGLEIVREYDPSESVLLATLTAMLLDQDAGKGLDHLDELLGRRGRQLQAIEPALRLFVEHCALAPIIATEESPVSPKVLTAMVTGAASICVAVITVAAAPVLVAAAVGVGTVTVVAVVGPAAIALGERLHDAIAP